MNKHWRVLFFLMYVSANQNIMLIVKMAHGTLVCCRRSAGVLLYFGTVVVVKRGQGEWTADIIASCVTGPFYSLSEPLG